MPDSRELLVTLLVGLLVTDLVSSEPDSDARRSKSVKKTKTSEDWGSEDDLFDALTSEIDEALSARDDKRTKSHTKLEDSHILNVLSDLIAEELEEEDKRLDEENERSSSRKSSRSDQSQAAMRARQEERLSSIRSGGGEVRGGREGRQLQGSRDRSPRQLQEGCETTGYEVRMREVCEQLTREECETVQVTKYRKEIDQQCKTKIDQACYPITVDVPSKKCAPRYEKKCETVYKTVEEKSYKEECHEDVHHICEKHIKVPVHVEVPYPVKVPYPVYEQPKPTYKPKLPTPTYGPPPPPVNYGPPTRPANYGPSLPPTNYGPPTPPPYHSAPNSGPIYGLNYGGPTPIPNYRPTPPVPAYGPPLRINRSPKKVNNSKPNEQSKHTRHKRESDATAESEPEASPLSSADAQFSNSFTGQGSLRSLLGAQFSSGTQGSFAGVQGSQGIHDLFKGNHDHHGFHLHDKDKPELDILGGTVDLTPAGRSGLRTAGFGGGLSIEGVRLDPVVRENLEVTGLRTDGTLGTDRILKGYVRDQSPNLHTSFRDRTILSGLTPTYQRLSPALNFKGGLADHTLGGHIDVSKFLNNPDSPFVDNFDLQSSSSIRNPSRDVISNRFNQQFDQNNVRKGNVSFPVTNEFNGGNEFSAKPRGPKSINLADASPEEISEFLDNLDNNDVTKSENLLAGDPRLTSLDDDVLKDAILRAMTDILQEDASLAESLSALNDAGSPFQLLDKENLLIRELTPGVITNETVIHATFGHRTRTHPTHTIPGQPTHHIPNHHPLLPPPDGHNILLDHNLNTFTSLPNNPHSNDPSHHLGNPLHHSDFAQSGNFHGSHSFGERNPLNPHHNHLPQSPNPFNINHSPLHPTPNSPPHAGLDPLPHHHPSEPYNSLPHNDHHIDLHHPKHAEHHPLLQKGNPLGHDFGLHDLNPNYEHHNDPHHEPHHDPHHEPHHDPHHDPHHEKHHDPYHNLHHDIQHSIHEDSYGDPLHLPPPTITHEELPAPRGCKSVSTRTCQKVPIVVPKKVPYQDCRKVPAVECFFVLKKVPDLECAPKPYQDCNDVVKEVPYLAPEERCEDVPYDECSLVEEQIPVQVCRSVDLKREPFVSNPAPYRPGSRGRLQGSGVLPGRRRGRSSEVSSHRRKDSSNTYGGSKWGRNNKEMDDILSSDGSSRVEEEENSEKLLRDIYLENDSSEFIQEERRLKEANSSPMDVKFPE